MLIPFSEQKGDAMELINPLTNPLFSTVASVTGGILALFLVYTLFMERKSLGQLMKTSLFPRWLSSAILAPLVVLGIFSGPLALTVLITALSIIGVSEYSRVTGLAQHFRLPAYAFGAAIPLATALAPQLVTAIVVVSVLVLGSIAVFKYRTPAQSTFGARAGAGSANNTQVFVQAASAVLAVCYTPLLASFAIHISRMDGGAAILLSLIAAVGFSDTSAFIIGKAFGKKKMAPHVSPNKSWAGAVGNVIGAYLGFSIVLFVGPALPLAVLVGLPFLIAIASIIGDLFESLIKRSYGVKDAGTWLPGFGGILDRVDSLLFVLPVSYIVLSLLG